MTKENQLLINLYQPVIILREGLEYCLDGHPIKMDLHKKRGTFFGRLVTDSPLVKFLEANGENGAKVLTQLKEFNDDAFVYNRLITERGGYYYADESIRSKALDYVVGLHQTLLDIFRNIIKNMEKDNKVIDPAFYQVVIAEDNYYNAVAGFVLYNNIIKHHKEVSFEIQRNGGNSTLPHINFMMNDLKKIIGLNRFAQSKYTTNNPNIQSQFGQMTAVLNALFGANKLAPEEFNEKNTQLKNQFQANIKEFELAWRRDYAIIMEGLKKTEPPMPEPQGKA